MDSFILTSQWEISWALPSITIKKTSIFQKKKYSFFVVYQIRNFCWWLKRTIFLWKILHKKNCSFLLLKNRCLSMVNGIWCLNLTLWRRWWKSRYFISYELRMPLSLFFISFPFFYEGNISKNLFLSPCSSLLLSLSCDDVKNCRSEKILRWISLQRWKWKIMKYFANCT